MQLKLIRGMQQELNDRTARLDQVARDTNGWNADRVREQLDLTNRQGTLAGLAGAVAERRCAADPAAAAPPSDGPLEGLERALDRDAKPTPGRRSQGPARTRSIKQLLDGLPGEPPPAAPQSPAMPASRLTPRAARCRIRAGRLGCPAAHPLQRIGQRMREVEQRLAQRDLAEPTQAAQRQIVAELADTH